jgi:formiminotetrahydrofolate cyclodeaminase
MAAALLEKVAVLSLTQWSGAAHAGERAHSLRLQAEELVEEDAQAYLAFVEALRAAKGLTGEARARVVGPAHAKTVDVPLAIVRSGVEVVELASALAAHGNPNLRADAVVAATFAAAAAEAGAGLIEINLSATPGDSLLDEVRHLATDASAKVGALRRASTP